MAPAIVLFCVCMLVSSTFGGHVQSQVSQQHSYITEVKSFSRLGDDDACSFCTEWSRQALQALIQAVLQVGVVDSCGDLCQVVGDKTYQIVGFLCTIGCDVVGIKEFINIINRADIDPIYYCELVRVCPIMDNGDAKITTFEVNPKSGPRGTIFDISFEYLSKNGTGTGEISLAIDTVDGVPLAQSFLHEIAPAGTYDGAFKLDAEKDPNCDPSQEPCEDWKPGDYTVRMAICNGQCGSKHPHSAIYDEASTTFKITKKNNTIV